MAMVACGYCGETDDETMLGRIEITPPQFVPLGKQIVFVCADCMSSISVGTPMPKPHDPTDVQTH